MLHRRILSIWFPRLAAERVLRGEPALGEAPFAVVAEVGNSTTLASLNVAASKAGLRRDMGLRDAQALCPDLVTRSLDPLREAAFLSGLRRWAGRFSPWVAEQGDEGLVLDISGCAHLFGGEQGLLDRIAEDCARLHLTQQCGVADTLGAAWAVARYAGAPVGAARSGDAIDQEARATRSRAQKRRNWERGGVAPAPRALPHDTPRIIAPGQTRAALAPLPVSALRLAPETVAGLVRMGLRRIGELSETPRGALARRFGVEVVRRLDQALGSEPEPVSPARPAHSFAVRLSFPDPIGLEADILAGLDRLLPPLCSRLEQAGQGARRVRLILYRVDRSLQVLEVGLARPAQDPARIRSLLVLRMSDVEAGYGIDTLRLVAHVTEPLNPTQHKGHLAAVEAARALQNPDGGAAVEALISRLGARVGLESITRLHPADSHIPEKTAKVVQAAFSAPATDWPAPAGPRPLRMFPPEAVATECNARPPQIFRWRRRVFHSLSAVGPERITPEWWLDDPNWRSGPRDYWRVETETGERLWLFEALGAETSGGWYVQGDFG